MKKFIYILLFSVVASVSISSCTEENVEPKHTDNNGGGVSERP